MQQTQLSERLSWQISRRGSDRPSSRTSELSDQILTSIFNADKDAWPWDKHLSQVHHMVKDMWQNHILEIMEKTKGMDFDSTMQVIWKVRGESQPWQVHAPTLVTLGEDQPHWVTKFWDKYKDHKFFSRMNEYDDL